MSRRYSSFVVRVWRGAEESCWVEVEHVQSGERARLDSVGLAAVWMSARSDSLPSSAWPSPGLMGGEVSAGA